MLSVGIGERYGEYFLLLLFIIHKIVNFKVDNNVFWNTQIAPACTILIKKIREVTPGPPPPSTNLNSHHYMERTNIHLFLTFRWLLGAIAPRPSLL